MKATSLFALLFFLGCSFVFSQDRYRIVYDYQTDQTSYYRLGPGKEILDTLSKPKFKRKSSIEIKLLNVNPFAVSVIPSITETNIHESQSGFRIPLPDNLGLGNFLGENIGFASETGSRVGVASLFHNSNATESESTELQSRGEKASTAEDELNKMSALIEGLNYSLRSDMLNPNLDKEKIMENLLAATKIIKDNSLEDPNKNMHIYLASLKNAVRDKRTIVESEVFVLQNRLESSSHSEQLMSRGEIADRNNMMRQLGNYSSNLEETINWAINNIDDIQYLYGLLESSSFENSLDFEVTADETDIQLQFVSTDDNNSRTLKVKELKAYSKGGFKINSGVGITVLNMGPSAKDYYISQEGTIEFDKDKDFKPSLSAVMNFYPMISENFNLGGTFGVVVPLMSENPSVNFVLGPSLFFGGKNRISLNGGVVLGPVSKLTGGYHAGDTFSQYSLDPYLKTKYDFGFFFGVSFNVLNLN